MGNVMSWIKKILIVILALLTGMICVQIGMLPVERWFDSKRVLLTILLILMGFCVLTFQIIRKIFITSSEPVTIFSPYCYFPAIYSLWYGLGALRFYKYQQNVAIENYYYYYYGLASYFVGLLIVKYGFIFSCSLQNKNKSTVTLFRSFLNNSKGRLIVLTVCSITLTVGSYILATTGIGLGLADFQESRTLVIRKVSGYLYYLGLMASDIMIVLIIWKMVSGKHLFKPNWVNIFIIIICLLYLILLGSRTRVIYPIVVPSIFFYIYRSLKGIRLKFLLPIIFVPVFIVLFGAYRHVSGNSENLLLYLQYVLSGEMSLISNAFARLLQFFPSKIDFIGIKVLYQPFLTLLPGQQESIVDYLKVVLDLDYRGGGFTPSLLGGFYIINGFSSILIGMVCIGIISGWLFKTIEKPENRTILDTLIYSYWIVYSLNILKGGFLKDIEPLFHMTILYIIFRFSTTKNSVQSPKKNFLQPCSGFGILKTGACPSSDSDQFIERSPATIKRFSNSI